MKTGIKDKNSVEWLRVKDYCLERLKELREENDGDLSAVETATLRGMIKLTKEILSLEETEIAVEVKDQTYIE